MLDKINSLKGYMPLHEGGALAKWAEKFSKVGPILEIGTFGGKSAAFLAYGSRKNNQIVYTCLLYTSPSPRDRTRSRMPSSA